MLKKCSFSDSRYFTGKISLYFNASQLLNPSNFKFKTNIISINQEINYAILNLNQY